MERKTEAMPTRLNLRCKPSMRWSMSAGLSSLSPPRGTPWHAWRKVTRYYCVHSLAWLPGIPGTYAAAYEFLAIKPGVSQLTSNIQVFASAQE